MVSVSSSYYVNSGWFIYNAGGGLVENLIVRTHGVVVVTDVYKSLIGYAGRVRRTVSEGSR